MQTIIPSQTPEMGEFPEVEVPGLDEAEVIRLDEYRQEVDWYQRTKAGMLRALFLKGTPPFTGKAKPKRKLTRHRRLKANANVRSQYLKAAA